MELSDRIQEVRKIYRLSRREFGERLGVSQDVIGNMEYNRLKRPEQKEPLLKLICSEFGVDELWLRTGEGEIFKNSDLDFDNLAAKISLSDNELLKNIVGMLWTLDTEALEAIQGVVKVIKKENNPNP